MRQTQHTITRTVSFTGVGLHTGQRTTLTFHPADANSGMTFERTDLPGRPRIPVRPESACYDPSNGRRTILRANGGEVHTVEHVLAALTGLGVDNIRIEIDGMEAGEPADGSALPFAILLLEAGLTDQGQPRRFLKMPGVITHQQGDVEFAKAFAQTLFELFLTDGQDARPGVDG